MSITEASVENPLIAAVTCGGYDCSGDYTWTPEELEAVAQVFVLGAAAARAKTHGEVKCEMPDGTLLASVSIDTGGEFSEETGLPILHEVKYPGGRNANFRHP